MHSIYWKSANDSSTNLKDLWRSIKSVLWENNDNMQNTGNSLNTKPCSHIHASTNDAALANFHGCWKLILPFLTQLLWMTCTNHRNAPAKQSSLDSSAERFLKNFVDLLVPWLATIFNPSLETGYSIILQRQHHTDAEETVFRQHHNGKL